MKRALFKGIPILLIAVTLMGCKALSPFSKEEGAPSGEPEPPAYVPTAISEPPPSPMPSMKIIGQGLPEQFWQAAVNGAETFSDENGVTMTFVKLPDNADAKTQREALDNALDESVSALCISGLDGYAVAKQLERARNEKVPVVSFADGIDDGPEGIVASTVSTLDFAAGELAAESMFANHTLLERIRNATPSNPVTIAVQPYSALEARHPGRTRGFLDKMETLVRGANPLGAQITGNMKYIKPSEGAAINLEVTISDENTVAGDILNNTDNLIGYFCPDEESANTLLDATSAGKDLDKSDGIYMDLVVVGFDAGAKQKNAVKNRYFHGSVTQDPYNMGYMAAKVAYDVLQGDEVPDEVNTGCFFYTDENMNNSAIAPLLYD